MTETPIACTLTDAELASRRAGMLERLRAQIVDRSLLGDRLELRFPGSEEALALVMDVVRAERDCCRFLRFEIVAEPDLGPLRLVVTGPPGTGAFLDSMLPA